MVSIYFGIPRLDHKLKTNCKISDFLEKSSGTSFSTKISAWVFKKNVSHVILYQMTKYCLMPLFLQILGNLCIAIISFSVDGVMDFELNFSPLIKPFSYMTNYCRTKIKIFKERKDLLRWSKKYFSSFLKDFQLSQGLFQQNWSDLIKFYSARNYQKNDDRNHQKMMIQGEWKLNNSCRFVCYWKRSFETIANIQCCSAHFYCKEGLNLSYLFSNTSRKLGECCEKLFLLMKLLHQWTSPL